MRIGRRDLYDRHGGTKNELKPLGGQFTPGVESMNKYDQRMKQLMYFGDTIITQELRCVTDDELDEAERAIGYSLPDDYREFLRNYGEAFIGTGLDLLEPELAPEGFGGHLICSFYGVNSKHPGKDLVKEYQLRQRELPVGLLPIADGDYGLSFMSLGGETKGFIYCFGDGEFGDGENEKLYLLARSFAELLKRLEPQGEPEPRKLA